MFGTNEIVGRKFFANHANHDNLMVTSVFLTLQGEGPLMGRPAVFVRLSKCNLDCDFCDTAFDHGEWMERHVLTDEILRVADGHNLRRLALVITGGEPTLQHRALYPLLVICAGFFDKVQIESNGILPMVLPNSTVLVVSPKCVNGHYIKPHDDMLERANALKFVITADERSPYHTVPLWAFKWLRQNRGTRTLYVSPMAEYNNRPAAYDFAKGDLQARSRAERVSFWEPGLLDLDKVRKNHEYAATYALEHGCYLSLQMQLFCGVA